MADPKSQCAEELAAAMKEEYVTDPQGRRVRRWHAIPKTAGEPKGSPSNLSYMAFHASEGGRKCTVCCKYRRADDLHDASGCDVFGRATVCYSGLICGACLEKAKAENEK